MNVKLRRMQIKDIDTVSKYVNIILKKSDSSDLSKEENLVSISKDLNFNENF